MIALRLPADLEEAIRELAQQRGRRWQTTLKDLLREGLGLEPLTEDLLHPSASLKAAIKRLGKP